MPICPAYDCAGGSSLRVRAVDDLSVYHVPAGLNLQPGEQMYRCGYCGFLWTEKEVPGLLKLVRRAIGYYDNIAKPNEFFAAPFHKLKDDSGPDKRRWK